MAASTSHGSAQVAPDSLTVLAREAYVFAFPALAAYRTMYQSLAAPGGALPFNAFRHTMRLADPTFRGVVRPNNDTFYSLAPVDLRTGGVILTVPAAPNDRYRSAQVIDQFTHNIAIISDAFPEARRYLVVGPHSTAQAPADVHAVIRAETGFVLILTRTAVNGPSDSASAAAIQTGFILEALGPSGDAADFPEYREDAATSADFVRYLNFVLGHSRIHESEQELVRALTPIGVGTTTAPDALTWTPAVRSAIERGVSEARERIRAGTGLRQLRGSWAMTDAWGDRERMQGKYLQRATAALYGLFGLDREEAAYFGTSVDGGGEHLRGGDRAYIMRFPPDSAPPVRAFWSVTVYDSTGYLIPNPIGRYSIGDRTAGLRRDADGGVTIYLQTNPPAAQNGVNWLPVPQGSFSLNLRLYRPDPLRIDAYTPPAVQLIK
jgi:hypothetical protein